MKVAGDPMGVWGGWVGRVWGMGALPPPVTRGRVAKRVIYVIRIAQLVHAADPARLSNQVLRALFYDMSGEEPLVRKQQP